LYFHVIIKYYIQFMGALKKKCDYILLTSFFALTPKLLYILYTKTKFFTNIMYFIYITYYVNGIFICCITRLAIWITTFGNRSISGLCLDENGFHRPHPVYDAYTGDDFTPASWAVFAADHWYICWHIDL